MKAAFYRIYSGTFVLEYFSLAILEKCVHYYDLLLTAYGDKIFIESTRRRMFTEMLKSVSFYI